MTAAKPKRIRKPKVISPHSDATRPSIYHAYWGQKIESHLAQGWSLRRFCEKPGNPSYSTVNKWLRDPTLTEFHEHHARGREAAADSDADFVGYVNEEAMHGRIDPQVARVVIDARKWQAAIRKPKKYGQRVELGGAGRDGAILVQFAEGDDKLM